jgi:long-chain acyl-CoA synthetase
MYESRPWRKHYPPGTPDELTSVYENALAMFTYAAQDYPDRPALYYFDNWLTYRAVDRASSALATALTMRGVTKGDRVALYLQNTPQFVIGLYAIWKIGGIAVMCNPMFKRQELTYHLNDSGAKVLICLESLYETVARETVPDTNVRLVITTCELDYLGDFVRPSMLANITKQRFEGTLDFKELAEQFDGQKVITPTLRRDEIAFLTYTSGTTGQPKGALNTHGNVVYTAEFYRSWMQLDETDVIVGVAPFFHITGLIAHIATAALTALPIITFYRFDAPEMLRLVEKWRGTFTVAAITAYIALMDCPDIKTRDLSSFKKLFSGGAPVSPATVANFQALTGTYIHNIYGMTETTSPSHATPYGVAAPVDPHSGALAVGVPIPGTDCRIIDVETGEVLPPGEAGELLTKGPQVVPGYWQKPEESAKAIRDGFLHTGDVARMDADGWFYLVDRKKDMIVASGFKVYPREVEDVLYQHPAVRQAAVIGVPDEYRSETVKAFVALKTGYEGNVTPDELIAFCKERLANYKYPRQLEILPEIPQTATGKFLRRALREQGNK